MERNKRKTLKGTVTSDSMDKTIIVEVKTLKLHPRVKKYYKTSKKYHVHDEKEECKVGDSVEIMETKPLSKTKCWRVIKILKKVIS
jgi:small subunit ribosomal protein S17